MLKCYCEDHERDWDVGVTLLIFAVRERTQESLGFSPFQLVFGHRVMGPFKLIKEKWLDTIEQTGLLSYVMSFKERLTEACELASKHCPMHTLGRRPGMTILSLQGVFPTTPSQI